MLGRRVSFDPFTAAAIDDPYPQYHALRAADPVHWSDKLESWVLFRHDDVGAFFRDDERLSSDRSKATQVPRRRQRAQRAAAAHGVDRPAGARPGARAC